MIWVEEREPTTKTRSGQKMGLNLGDDFGEAPN